MLRGEKKGGTPRFFEKSLIAPKNITLAYVNHEKIAESWPTDGF